ncbi:FAM172 family protein homolog CG10038 [Phlebotomus papatasi]|uniref:FAM172 family protein homolog CG10038 n=1 Tax=Phlebotomus papatasi TaxID=29031 RepID=UPI0024843E98|nr:FAM172 family protein homolog CG10038 [Phlebotomus papatasi]
MWLSSRKTLLLCTLVLRFKLTNRAMHHANSVKTLADFGYGFNEAGQLRQINPVSGTLTNKPFEFAIFEKKAHNQKRYEELGEVITDYVYNLLEARGMIKLPIPVDAPLGSGTFIYSTTRELCRPEKLMILIHGSGVVRAGQWSRSLIINDSIWSGTQLLYLEEARKQGYEVIITNTNDNYRDEKSIPGSEDSISHAMYVWKHYIIPSNPKAVAIVAHSYGGIVTMELAKKHPAFFKDKVFAIGLTDSVHIGIKGLKDFKEHIKKISRNWVRSEKPLDTKLESGDPNDVPHYSAGHMQHEYTSSTCMSALFDFFKDRYEASERREM